MMTIAHYHDNALRTAKMLPTLLANLQHAALGMMTEPGEYATELKRHAIYGKPLTEDMVKHMSEELGDSVWYIPLMLHHVGRRLDQVVNDHILSDEWAADIRGTDITLAFATMQLAHATGSYALTLIELEEALRTDPDALPDAGRIEDVAQRYVVAVAVICVHLGLSVRQVLQENIDKLRLRFPDAYTDHAAEARADKGGLDARSS
jgi:hypothetical protein